MIAYIWMDFYWLQHNSCKPAAFYGGVELVASAYKLVCGDLSECC